MTRESGSSDRDAEVHLTPEMRPEMRIEYVNLSLKNLQLLRESLNRLDWTHRRDILQNLAKASEALLYAELYHSTNRSTALANSQAEARLGEAMNWLKYDIEKDQGLK